MSREVVAAHEARLGTAATATFIVGGQIAGERPEIFLVYSRRRLDAIHHLPEIPPELLPS